MADGFEHGEEENNKAPEDQGVHYSGKWFSEQLRLAKCNDHHLLKPLPGVIESIIVLPNFQKKDEPSHAEGKKSELSDKNDEKDVNPDRHLFQNVILEAHYGIHNGHRFPGNANTSNFTLFCIDTDFDVPRSAYRESLFSHKLHSSIG